MSERRDQNDVRIARIDDDRADMARVLQADVCPRLSGIGGLVHAVTVGDVAAKAGFTAAGVKNVVVGVGQRNRADRGDALVIEGGRPGHAAVGALEDATRDRAEIIGVGIAGNAGDGKHAAAAEWARSGAISCRPTRAGSTCARQCNEKRAIEQKPSEIQRRIGDFLSCDGVKKSLRNRNG